MLLGSGSVKAVHRTLMKLSSGDDQNVPIFQQIGTSQRMMTVGNVKLESIL